jgi:hypothetical protein
MHRIRVSCAISLSLLSIVVSGQSATAALPEALRAHVKDDRFDMVTSIRGFPLGVRSGLQSLFGSFELDIAEPGAKFQVTGTNLTPVCRSAGWSRGLLDRSLPRALRARRYRTHLARRAVSLDAGRDSIRMGRCRARTTRDNRRHSEGRAVRSHQELEGLVVGPMSPHLRGHLLLFDPKPAPEHSPSAGVRLLLAAVSWKSCASSL